MVVMYDGNSDDSDDDNDNDILMMMMIPFMTMMTMIYDGSRMIISAIINLF